MYKHKYAGISLSIHAPMQYFMMATMGKFSMSKEKLVASCCFFAP